MKLKSRNIRNSISKLERMSFKDVNESYIRKVVNDLMIGYKVQAPAYNPPLTIYRGRICEKPNSISELSYPPKKYVSELGRGNEIGQPMFYGATHSHVPFYELRCKPGDTIALSTWRTSSKLILNHVGFSDEIQDQLESKRDLNEIYDFVKATRNYGELNEMVHEYLAYLFSRPIQDGNEKVEYKLTSSIANLMMHSSEINGLMYPTIQMFGNADNILLKPEYVDENLDFVNVEFIEVNESNKDGFSINRIDSATALTSTNGALNWSGRPLHWELNQSGMIATFEFKGDGNWEGRDQNGNLIDPV
ncbi:hypothetical protein I6M45_21740 [Shewanella algae]|uniref:hypothetical protein n=1 Tax=Shewanella algae TaxID=38313 RepID=UPI001AAC8C52|nr:hypothetical protein [Shewanella algae]MBO2647710.1 hypothetical protein [Shewanella algae]